MLNIFESTTDAIAKYLENSHGKGHYHARALTRSILKQGNRDYHTACEFTASPRLTEKISGEILIPTPEISRVVSEGNTTKFLLRFDDGCESESVVIPMQNHATLCVSSQVGCKLGCRFCETGAMGFFRNLTPSEIVSQVFAARFILRKPIKNIVFMGMGEPFDNFANVKKAIEVLTDHNGLDFSHSHITLSTAGMTGGIRKLGRLGWTGIHLAVSLNAPNDRIRSELMPINTAYSMADLKNALMEYPLKRRGLFLIEYIVITGVNDSKSHADELVEYLRPLKVRLNLIPLNKTSRFGERPTEDSDIHRFATYFDGTDIFVVKRWSKGSSFAAGCGQLGGGPRTDP